jgi:hypothetical protein
MKRFKDALCSNWKQQKKKEEETEEEEEEDIMWTFTLCNA